MSKTLYKLWLRVQSVLEAYGPLSRKVITQAVTAVILWGAGFAAVKLGLHVSAEVLTFVPVIAGAVAGYLVPERTKFAKGGVVRQPTRPEDDSVAAHIHDCPGG